MLTDADRSDAVFALEALPGWHANGRINAVLMNGSAQPMDQDECLGDLLRPVRRTSYTQPAAAKQP